MQNQLSAINALIKEFRISQPVIAKKMGMPIGSLKPKLNPNYTSSNFSKEEFLKLQKVIKELFSLTEKACIEEA